MKYCFSLLSPLFILLSAVLLFSCTKPNSNSNTPTPPAPSGPFTATITRNMLTPGPNWINPSTGSSNASNDAFIQSGILFDLKINTQNNPAQGPFYITVTSNNGDTLYQLYNLALKLPPDFTKIKNDTLTPGKKVQISNDRVGYTNDTLAYLARKITGNISMNVTISNSQGYSINIPINFTVGSSFKASITPFSANPTMLTPGKTQPDSAYFTLSVDTSVRPKGISTGPFYAKVTSTNGDTLYRIINTSFVRQYDTLLPNTSKTILLDKSNQYKDTLLYIAKESYGTGGSINITVQISNNPAFGDTSNQTISLQTTAPSFKLTLLPALSAWTPSNMLSISIPTSSVAYTAIVIDTLGNSGLTPFTISLNSSNGDTLAQLYNANISSFDPQVSKIDSLVYNSANPQYASAVVNNARIGANTSDTLGYKASKVTGSIMQSVKITSASGTSQTINLSTLTVSP